MVCVRIMEPVLPLEGRVILQLTGESREWSSTLEASDFNSGGNKSILACYRCQSFQICILNSNMLYSSLCTSLNPELETVGLGVGMRWSRRSINTPPGRGCVSYQYLCNQGTTSFVHFPSHSFHQSGSGHSLTESSAWGLIRQQS